MSDKMQPPAKPIEAASGGKSTIWLIGGLAFLAALAIGLGSPTLLVFMLIGFAPTIASGVIDTDAEKHGAIAVGAMSLAAMIPLVLDQLTARNSSYTVLGDPFAWLMVYGASGVGWGIHTATPAITVALSNFRADWRRDELKKLQETLTEEWGPEVVTSPKPAPRTPAAASPAPGPGPRPAT